MPGAGVLVLTLLVASVVGELDALPPLLLPPGMLQAVRRPASRKNRLRLIAIP
jgi:hypothetical protein